MERNNLALNFVNADGFWGKVRSDRNMDLLLSGEEQTDSGREEGDKIFTAACPCRRSSQNGTVGNNLLQECVSKDLQAILASSVEYERMKGCLVEPCSNSCGGGEGPYLRPPFSREKYLQGIRDACRAGV